MHVAVHCFAGTLVRAHPGSHAVLGAAAVLETCPSTPVELGGRSAGGAEPAPLPRRLPGRGQVRGLRLRTHGLSAAVRDTPRLPRTGSVASTGPGTARDACSYHTQCRISSKPEVRLHK